ncbi:glycosyl hydrolase family 95 catalytic domain-containing protein [Streptomyces physcomitrii]|uniref:Glycoside hydrolase family 95 protein n=1 Tax=Streptomyces physcomitrii TaxID=2724184 RepID=A0ABX1HA54_9ACTN|nr:glycoside hydrolase N-terminal domain-containing protein [Streptomyces physcomitrii]NKI44185.1 glycoside hydrolase family 95 protein [Streptomyces physcomitrii]
MTPPASPTSGTPAEGALSRRGVLRAGAVAGAAFSLAAVPEFAPRAAAVTRPESAPLVPAAEALGLWYRRPGAPDALMREGLPVGNGRLGALSDGHPAREEFTVTDAAMWTGGPNAALDGEGQFPYGAQDFGSFGQLCRLRLEVTGHTPEAVTGYRRTLDLSNGLVTAAYGFEGTDHRREVYASAPDDVLVVRLGQRGGGVLTGSLELAGTRGETVHADRGAATVSFAAELPNALAYAALVKAVVRGGKVSAAGSRITFAGCTEVLLIVSGGTNYTARPETGYLDPEREPLALAAAKAEAAARAGGEALLATHVADYQRLHRRTAVSLGTSSAEQRALDTPARLAARAAAGAAPDPELEASYLQFGRYLMICGSRGGGLPLNLQGLWIDRDDPAWMSDYHTDINVQMNYWLPDRLGLPECFEALTDYCLSQLPRWESATRELFNDSRNGFRNTSGKIAGWTVAISTNVWGGNGWWWHPPGNAWLCNSLFEHYQYTGDTGRLRRIYPLLKGACEFWEARLITTTVTDPATGESREVLIDDHDWSAEHGPTDTRGITYAQELVWQLFRNYRTAAAVLRRDSDYARTVAGLQDRLHLPGVSRTTGGLQEWMTDENLGETTHRHLSPLAGLFPGDRITVEDSPKEIVDGATALLTARGMDTYGWASAWRALCWARLKNAEKAYRLVLAVLKPSVDHGNGSAPNFFDMYRLGATSSVFQIDANFGIPAAMAEMLVQSRPDRVELLPALPGAWSAEGSARGLGVRGGFTVDLRWRAGRVTEATLHGRPGARTTVVIGGHRRAVRIPAGGSLRVEG